MSRKIGNAQSRATFFRHSAVLRLPAVLLRKLANTILHFLHTVRFNVCIPVVFPRFAHVLKKDLERVEKRAPAITCPGLSYTDALELSNIVSINDYIASLCNKTFTSIVNDPTHRLHAQAYSSVSHRAMIYATKGGLLLPNVKQNVLRIVF